MQEDHRGSGVKVVVIGAGLSGLTAAQHILKSLPYVNLTVLEAMDRVGGRTCSVDINGAIFDLGGTWIGKTQTHAQNLAQRANNQLIPQYHQGTKILDINKRISTYRSNIPLDVGILGLVHMQFNLWKLDRMSNKINPLNPRSGQLAFKWDSQTVRSWMDSNIYIHKVKLLFQCAVRAVLGCETDQVSFLFFLLYIRQNGGINNLINIENGLQERKMIKGAQHLSNFLKAQVQKRGGKVHTNCSIKKIIKKEDNSYMIYDQNSKKYQADYIIIAMPPARVNKIQFEPQLSRERRYICSRNLMGSCSKVLYLYDQPYWRNKGFSGQTLSDCIQTPIFNAYDDSRPKRNGEYQYAMVIFLNASVDREWSKNRQAAEKRIGETLATYFKCQQMLNPISVHWKVWNQEQSLNGGPIAFFPPGVLTKIDDIRSPEGRIHWAGTEMATQSQGFMDGAISSGIKVGNEIIEQIKKQKLSEPQNNKPSSHWYSKIIRSSRKWIEWL